MLEIGVGVIVSDGIAGVARDAIGTSWIGEGCRLFSRSLVGSSLFLNRCTKLGAA